MHRCILLHPVLFFISYLVSVLDRNTDIHTQDRTPTLANYFIAVTMRLVLYCPTSSPWPENIPQRTFHDCDAVIKAARVNNGTDGYETRTATHTSMDPPSSFALLLANVQASLYVVPLPRPEFNTSFRAPLAPGVTGCITPDLS
jgi:hypothetical protein